MAFTKITRATDNLNTGFGRVNTLIDDLGSTDNAKGASQIGVEDTAGNVSADNVEDALAEIYTDFDAVKDLEDTFKENPSTTTGLTWGYQAGIIRLDATVTSIAAGTLGLADDDTNYVEIDPSDQTIKTNTTSFTSGRIPLREITTVGGSQTVSTDKRAWFTQTVAESSATTSASGIVELSTDTESVTGTSDAVVVTPGTLTARLAAPGAIGGTTAAAGSFTNVVLTSINTDVSSTEIGYLDGVTSAVQTQLNTLLTVTGSVKTAAYTVLTSDVNKQIILGSATAADRIFTLPAVGAGEDGIVIHFYNDSNFQLTIHPNGTDSVWNAGNGYGVESTKPGSFISLIYDHTNTNWKPMNSGGFWRVEGLKLWMPLTANQMCDVDSTIETTTPDRSGNHAPTVNDGVMFDGGNSDTYPTSALFDGADEYIDVADSTDWDIFGSASGDTTLMWRVRFNALGGMERLISHFEADGDTWSIYKSSSNIITAVMYTGTATEIGIGGDAVSATTWYDMALIKIGTDVGLYIDGDQVGYDGTFNPDTYSGSLFIGQEGDDAGWINGRMNDVVISHSNLFNAAPVVGETDTITIPSHLNLVMGD